MKNIIAITLTILAILLIGFLALNFMPKTTDLSIYFPSSFSTTKTFLLSDITARNEPYTVSLGITEEDPADFKVTSMQGQYTDVDGRLALIVIPQKLVSDEITSYEEKAWNRFQAPSRGGVSEKEYVNGYDVYVSFRELAENTDTSKMLILGSGYVFVPEKKVVLAYTLYNTRLYACEDLFNPDTCLFDEKKELPTIDDAKQIGAQLISNFKSK